MELSGETISLPLMANVTSPGKLPIWLEICRFITPIDSENSQIQSCRRRPPGGY